MVSEGEVEPVVRRLPFECPRRQRRSRGTPRGGAVAASGLELDGAGQAVMPAVRRNADPNGSAG